MVILASFTKQVLIEILLETSTVTILRPPPPPKKKKEKKKESE